MKEENICFKEVALLITHYNRSSSLERLLKSFADLHISFNEVIVSDDASDSKHLNYIKKLKKQFDFKLICSEKNRGLGNNINKGQLEISSPFTLYIQEDFIPRKQFCQRLKDGLTLMKEDQGIDLIRFYAYQKHPYLKPVKYGFSEIKFNFWWPSYWQFHCYSDHPHIRRSSFLLKFGKYAEGMHSDKAEFKMAISFLKKKGRALIHDNYKEIFDQQNSVEESSQIKRKRLRKYIQSQNSLLIKLVRMIYRNIKARIRYLFW